MTVASEHIAELYELAGAQCEDGLTADRVARLEELTLGDEALRRLYIIYMHVHACSENCARQFEERGARDAGQTTWERGLEDAGIRERGDLPQDVGSAVGPPIHLEAGVHPSPFILHPSSFTLHPSSLPLSPSFVGGPIFSYMVASIILGLMLFGAWAYTITHDHLDYVKNSRGQTAPGGSTPKTPELVSTGRITGLKDCRWSDPRTQIILGASVPLNRKFALSAGLLEITYRNGAKVILEGPCNYEVDARDGGFLSLGKLTARVDDAKPQAAKNQDPSPKTQDRNPKSPSSLIPHPSSLFTVRTPTAVVTDLGTEFGVEVNESGGTISHVFQGSVRMRIGGPGPAGGADGEIILGANESAIIEIERGKPALRRATAASGSFVRQLPRRVTIKLHNTGVGLQEGDVDPHWQISAVGGDPDFKPRQAVVSATPPYNRWLWNHPRRAQWISLSTTETGPAYLPADTYTYRTTFRLRGVDPASVSIKGEFLADNHVDAIRINGRNVLVPEHGFDIPIEEPVEFVVSEGFVEGENVLEFDVFNGGGSNPDPESASPTGLRVEFMGVTRASPSAPKTDGRPSKGGHKTKEP